MPVIYLLRKKMGYITPVQIAGKKETGFDADKQLTGLAKPIAYTTPNTNANTYTDTYTTAVDQPTNKAFSIRGI